MRTVSCDYCGQPAQFVDSAIVYGRSYGMIYYCPGCAAWVGVHKGTDQPLGRLANAELRKYKRAAHATFDPIWQSGRMRRNVAYAWLSERLGIPREETHIGMMDVDRCKQVIEICRKELQHEQV